MKPFKHFKDDAEDKKVYRYSNFLQSRDNNWVNRNSHPEDIREDLEDELREPIEEDIRD